MAQPWLRIHVFVFDRSVSNIARDVHKPLLATDIANKPLYMAMRGDDIGVLTTGVTLARYLLPSISFLRDVVFTGLVSPLVQFHALHFVIVKANGYLRSWRIRSK